jgi:SAM-dependent methyltransferase
MRRTDTYRRFAKYYDAYVRGFDADIPLYLACCEGRNRVVEIGCGTGRVLKPLLEAGHEVVGVDISKDMLAIAHQKLHSHVESGALRLVQHNFVDAPTEESFDAALVTFYTFNYIFDDEDQRSFLRHVAQSLERGGILAVDLFYPRPLAYPDQAGVWRKSAVECDGALLRLRDKREMIGSIERRDQVFATDAGEDAITTLRRFVTKQETESLLTQAGFVGVQFINGYDLSGMHPLQPNERTTGGYCVVADRSEG